MKKNKGSTMNLNRRDFLQSLLSAGAAFTLAPSRLLAASGRPSPKLVVGFLRGGLDGLSVLVPYREKAYYKARPDIAIAPPGRGETKSLKLTERFALHPSLESLQKYFQEEKLSFVTGFGLPQVVRSHFDAQDYMENGTPGRKSTRDGWLNRYLQENVRAGGSLRAVAYEPTLPFALRGRASAVALGSDLGGGRRAKGFEEAFAQMYSTEKSSQPSQASADQVQAAGKEGLEAMDQLRGHGVDMKGRRGGRSADAGLKALATVAREEKDFEVGFVSLGGWDTHVNQGSNTGQLARKLAALGKGVDSFVQELEGAFEDTVLVLMTEFGRTVEQNGNGGTDHGYGSVAMVLGGNVQGGQILGRWPGLSPSKRRDGRDVEVTTDFRLVLTELLGRHLGANRLEKVFPGFSVRPNKWLGLMQA